MGGNRLGSNPEVEKLARLARRAGFVVKPNHSGHLVWIPPTKEGEVSEPLISPMKFGDTRRIHKISKFLRENGVDVPGQRPRKKLARSREGERFFLRLNDLPWQEVTRDQWVEAEGRAGFHPKGGSDRATQGFRGNGIQGISTIPDNHASIREVYADLPD